MYRLIVTSSLILPGFQKGHNIHRFSTCTVVDIIGWYYGYNNYGCCSKFLLFLIVVLVFTFVHVEAMTMFFQDTIFCVVVFFWLKQLAP